MPQSYAAERAPTAFERELWARFWELAEPTGQICQSTMEGVCVPGQLPARMAGGCHQPGTHHELCDTRVRLCRRRSATTRPIAKSRSQVCRG